MSLQPGNRQLFYILLAHLDFGWNSLKSARPSGNTYPRRTSGDVFDPSLCCFGKTKLKGRGTPRSCDACTKVKERPGIDAKAACPGDAQRRKNRPPEGPLEL